MKIARILYPVHALGPGRRVAIWTYGCRHFCEDCANPELWKAEGLPEMKQESLEAYFEQLLSRGSIEGITITGGDPFLYPESLLEILEVAEKYTDDILVYTGFYKEELEQGKGMTHAERENGRRALEKIAVLIDGPYVKTENKGHVLRGSENQRIFYLNEKYREKYEIYIKENQGKYIVENFPAKGGVISVGIHKPDFREKIEGISLGGKNE